MNATAVRALLVMVLLGLALVTTPTTWAAGVVSTCDEAHFDTALTGGGLVTFTCGPATITVTSTKTIAASTTIDGGSVIAISGGGSVQVFTVNFGSTFTVQNLTIQNGKEVSFGGGITNNGTTIVTNCTLSGNTGGEGGAIYSGNTLTVTGSTFTGNSSTVDGGAIYNDGTVTVTNSTFTGNSVLAPGDAGGGAIWSGFTATITGSTISGNSVAGGLKGGGIYNDSTMTITTSVISGNFAGPSGGNGGGIFNDDILTISDSTISGNVGAAGGNGAGLYHNGVTLTMDRSTISGNTTSGGGDGGGIYVDGINAALTNVTITGNTAAAGGGLFNNGNGVNITATTIASNTGGGIGNNGVNVSLTGTIIANNGVNCTNTGGGITDTGTNLQFPGATCGGSIPTADPLLQPLANNGGPTQTMALSAGSPAIDANTEICPPTPATDQRGITRPQGPACDIGAFELAVGLVGTPVNFTAVQGLPFAGAVATFTSANPANVAADFTATINWGDATTTPASSITGSAGSFTVNGTHTYATAGPFTATVTINDTSPVATVTVTDSVTVVPVLAGAPVNFTESAGVPFTGPVATFTSANPANVAADFTATINWGDGSTSPGTITGGAGSFTVTGTHTFATAGPFTATVTISDTSPVASVTETDSVNAFAAAPTQGIPTLNAWGLAALAVLLGALGLCFVPGASAAVRRRRPF